MGRCCCHGGHCGGGWQTLAAGPAAEGLPTCGSSARPSGQARGENPPCTCKSGFACLGCVQEQIKVRCVWREGFVCGRCGDALSWSVPLQDRACADGQSSRPSPQLGGRLEARRGGSGYGDLYEVWILCGGWMEPIFIFRGLQACCREVQAGRTPEGSPRPLPKSR